MLLWLLQPSWLVAFRRWCTVLSHLSWWLTMPLHCCMVRLSISRKVAQNTLASMVCQAPHSVSAIELHRQLHWLLIRHRIYTFDPYLDIRDTRQCSKSCLKTHYSCCASDIASCSHYAALKIVVLLLFIITDWCILGPSSVWTTTEYWTQ